MLQRDALLKLSIQPGEQLAALPPLHRLPRLPQRHIPRRALLASGQLVFAGLQARLFLFQELVRRTAQRPPAQDRRPAHHLVLVPAQQVFAVREQHLDLPARRNMAQQHGRIRRQVAAGPVPHGAQRAIQVLPYNHHLAGIQFADLRADHMHIDLLPRGLPPRPGHCYIILCRQAGRILRQALPAPALRRAAIRHANGSVALEATGNQEPARPRRLSDLFGTVPGVHQHMRARARRGHERGDELHQQIHFALEAPARAFATGLLLIEVGRLHTPPTQDYIEHRHQTVARQRLLGGGTVVAPQPLHLAALGFVHRRVVANQIPGHEGWGAMTPTRRTLSALTRLFGRDGGGDLLPKGLCCKNWRRLGFEAFWACGGQTAAG